jgi:hypothetical protein
MEIFRHPDLLNVMISLINPLRLTNLLRVSKEVAFIAGRYEIKDKYIQAMELRIQYPKLKYRKKISGASIIHYMVTNNKPIEDIRKRFPHGRYIYKHNSKTSDEFNMIVSLGLLRYFDDMKVRQIARCCQSQRIKAMNLCSGIAKLRMTSNTKSDLYKALRRYYKRFDDTDDNVIGYLGVWNMNTSFIDYLLQREPDLLIDDDISVEPSVRLTGKLIRQIELTEDEIEIMKKYWYIHYCSHTADITDVRGLRLKKIGIYAPIQAIEQMILRRPEAKDIFIRECGKRGLLHRVNAIIKL